MCRVGIVILAAGASTRMGAPKQLLPYRGVSLIRHAASSALASGCSPVVIVVGANADRILPELDGLSVLTITNPHWASGMGSTIRCGIATLAAMEAPPEAAILMLCDQPHISHALLAEMVRKYDGGACGIVACEYGGTVGVPALFASDLYPELMQLPPSGGAKTLLTRFADQVVRLPCPEAAIDVDTPADYQQIAHR